MSKYLKIASIILVVYGFVAGMLIEIPHTSIGNLLRMMFYHVSMWFAMITLLTVSLINSLKYLSDFDLKKDLKASVSGSVGMIFGSLGIITGMIWAKNTWGTYWTDDPKLNGAALAMFAYMAYFLVRYSIKDEVKRARISSVYNILAYVMMLLFVGIIPRLSQGSIHPGTLTNNPALNPTDLDSNMRLVFYPTALGWSLLSYWVYEFCYKHKELKIED